MEKGNRISILLSKDAEQDIDEAFIWYELRSEGLGDKFILSVENGFQYLRTNPEAFPIVFKNLRKHVMSKFPFNIYYRINEKNEIEVIRILHHKRKAKLIH